MVLCADSIKRYVRIEPAVWRKERNEEGLSFGLSEAGYDVRLSDAHASSTGRVPRGILYLAVTMERFEIPSNVIAVVHDKSSNARRGLLVRNTVLEPGWRGYPTLELSFDGPTDSFQLYPGLPIAQVMFHWLDKPTTPYEGRYQDQPEEPVRAKVG